jgi:nucleoside-diphosphate-sugar epimerase
MPELPLILVTGATGFVGRHLCEELVRRRLRVRGAHRGRHPEQPLVEWVNVGELGPGTDWGPALQGVTHVIHLAALAHQVGLNAEDLRRDFQRINVEATGGLLEQVAAAHIPGRFCFVSSSGAVCTLSEALITDETPCSPEGPYGQSKRAGEELVRETLHRAGQSWAILRPTLVYGPGNPGNMARLLRLVRTGLPLPLGALQNRRSFVFVGNLVDALIHCLDHPGAHEQVLAINDGEILSTPQLIRRIGHATGVKVRLFPVPMGLLRALARLGDLTRSLFGRSFGLDSYSLERLAGSHAVETGPTFAKVHWKPPFSMDEGLQMTFGGAPGETRTCL